MDATRLTVDFTADLMISDIIRRPPEPLAYLCIAVVLAGSLAPAVDRAPLGRRCRKQESRLSEQYSPPAPEPLACLSILSDASETRLSLLAISSIDFQRAHRWELGSDADLCCVPNLGAVSLLFNSFASSQS